MPVQAICGNCGKRYQLGDHLAGRRAKCKQCGAAFDIPAATVPTAAGAAAARSALPPLPTAPRTAARVAHPPVPAAATMATPAARPTPPSRPPPVPPADDHDGMPSLDALGELEATGKPDAFSNMRPPTIEAEPEVTRASAARRPTTIADANPARAAEIAKEKAKMNRRAMLAGAGGVLGTGTFGFAWFVLKLVGRTNSNYNRNQRRRQQEEDAESEADTDTATDTGPRTRTR